MTAALFLAFLAVMAAGVVFVCALYGGGRAASVVFAGLSGWFFYAGLLGYLGVFRNTAVRPPGAVFLFAPVLGFLVLFIVWTVRSGAGRRMAFAVPLWLLLGVQSFRIAVELFLHRLWIDGLIPKTLTFEGANVDIYVGASALLIAWMSKRGRLDRRLALVWNVLGLLALANVVVRAVLTSPGPLNLIHVEVPNRMVGTFPFLFIPGFFVPLAVVLHVLALRQSTGNGQ